MQNSDFKLEFSPERRKLEHLLVQEVKKAISELDVPEEEKRVQYILWEEYLLSYEHEYRRHQREYRERLILSN